MISANLITFINIFTIANLAILFILFWFRKNNVKSNKLFALIVFIPALTFFNNLLMYHQFLYDYYLFHLADSVSFLWGPFVLWYVMLLVGRGNKLRAIHALHLLPFVVILLMKIGVLMNEKYRNHFFDKVIETNGMEPLIYFLSNFLLLIQILTYLFVSFYKVLRYRKLEQLVFSNENKVKTKWLLELIVLLLLLDFTMILVYTFSGFDSLIIDLFFAPIADNVFYGLIVYKTFSHSALFTTESFHKYVEDVQPMIIYEEKAVLIEKTEAYRALDKSKYDEYADKIEQYFKTEKPYLNPNLTIAKLSESIHIPTHYISATLNQKLKTTFLDYVNSFRIEQVKIKLLEKQHLKYSIEAIGYDCGFNSKATFFRVFKKNTGKTCLEFVRGQEQIKLRYDTNSLLSDV